MNLCSEECTACCDFCVYCIHEEIVFDGEVSNGAPIGCSKYLDSEHQHIAESCGYCKDFYCFNIE